MGGEAKPQPGGVDGGNVGLRKVLLSEMHEVAGFFDGDLPVVVDDELAGVRGASGLGAADLVAQAVFRHVLHAQLHEFDADGHEAVDPVGAVDDEVEGIEFHENTAFPMTGVEGTAMSRGSSGTA